MRLASITKRGDRLSRTRRKFRAVGLASVVGVERSYSAKRASIMVRMLLGEWLYSYCAAVSRNWSTYLMRLSWTMTFHIRRLDSNWRGAKANWKSGLVFLNETSEHRVKSYILLRTELFCQRNRMSWHESCSMHRENIPCRFLIDLHIQLSFNFFSVNRWASHLATGFWLLCSSAPARSWSPASSHRSPCSSWLPHAMTWCGQSLVPPIHQAKEHSTIEHRMDWKELMMHEEWRLV